MKMFHDGHVPMLVLKCRCLSKETVGAKNRLPLQERSDSFALDNRVQKRARSPK